VKLEGLRDIDLKNALNKREIQFDLEKMLWNKYS
jgi:hypothetical protein